MKAATQAAMIDVVRQLTEAWGDDVADPQHWTVLFAELEDVWDTYMQEVADAEGTGFDGAVYDPARDDDRLQRQLGRVWDVMSDGQYRSIVDIASITGDPQPSVSAQLRHLRKTRHGSWIIDRQRVGETGLHVYRMRNPNGLAGPPWLPITPNNEGVGG